MNNESSQTPAQPENIERQPKKIQKLTKKKKVIVTVSVILGVLIILGAGAAIYINAKLNKLNTGGDISNYTDEAVFDSKIYDEDSFETIDADIHAGNFKDGIREWATNGGEIMSSKNVLNVLMIGFDSRNNEMIGNTDLIMLASLNKKTKQITLTSFLRDSYVYYDDGKGNTGYTKINAICNNYGINCLMETLENHYKIEIDHYVAVNFGSFETLVDAMGGINVTVKKYESDYYYTYFDSEIPYGEEVLLTGYQALGFCRIRKCDADGDVSRTRRQRMVIEAIINRVSSSSIRELDSYMDAVLPYISTDFSKGNILSVGTLVLTGGWYNYDRQEIQMPTEESRYGYSGSTWIWAIDFPLSGQALQNALFGSSNIQLTEGRVTTIDLLLGRSGTGSASANVTAGEPDYGEEESTEPEITTTVPVNETTTEVQTTVDGAVDTTVPVTGDTVPSQPDTTAEPTTSAPTEPVTEQTTAGVTENTTQEG